MQINEMKWSLYTCWASLWLCCEGCGTVRNFYTS